MSAKHLEEWITRLSRQELPAFAHTARSLAHVTDEDDSTADDLSAVILHDTGMTARVLRIANSVHYNPSGRAIDTVSYAIVILGFEQVRNLALTISMIDTVLGTKPKHQVQSEMICAYHAAVQAQRLASRSNPENLEAVYIGALLNRLGPIIFWCFPFGRRNVLEKAYKLYDTAQQAEKVTLGFTLDELTTALVSEWNLSEMLGKAMQATDLNRDDEKAISIGLGIANNVQSGWESPEVERKIVSASKYLQVSLKEAKKHVYTSARIAAEGLASFGFSQTLALILPKDESPAEPPKQERSSESFELELRILRQLAHLLSVDTDLNTMMMAVLEGIYRVVDMDQVVFALIDQKSKTLRAKLMIGQRRESIIKHQPSEVSSGEYLRQLLTKGEADWITRENCKQFRGKNIDPLIVKLGAQEFFVHPILMRDKAIGIIYADRFSSKLRFNKAHFRSFQHLADHASLAFRILSNQN